jgi:Cu+-exporting ATPase
VRFVPGSAPPSARSVPPASSRSAGLHRAEPLARGSLVPGADPANGSSPHAATDQSAPRDGPRREDGASVLREPLDDGSDAESANLGSETTAPETELDDAEDPWDAPSLPARGGWLTAALGLGVLAAILGAPFFSSTMRLPGGFALATAAAAFAALMLQDWTRAGRGPDSPQRAEPFARLPPLVAILAATSATSFGARGAAESVRLAGVVCAAAAASRIWSARQRRAHRRIERWYALALGATEPGGVPSARPSAAHELGKELVLRAGDRVPVDLVITAGEARVQAWPGARSRLRRRDGDGLLAGARVVDGALRAVVRWVGHDRGWARLSIDPTRRADRHLVVARLAERLATSGAIALGTVVMGVAISLDVPPLLALAHAAAAAAALGNVALPDVVALLIARSVHGLAEMGICFRSPAALDRAGRTSMVVFCDRGTLLSGELSIASVEPCPGMDDAELIGLLAGAYGGVASPIATALNRSLSALKLRPDATRSPTHLPGLGVTAVASNGQALVAGTRALLLERRISVASAEGRIAELEALGRSVLLAALDGRWVGLVALQDGLRPGARAATQSLLDAGVEPVLLSGEARETCRALARHIGIEHVRPEVLPQDRGAEVRRLSEAGGMLAVVGSSIDDAALAAAPLSIDIDPRGGPLERSDINVVSGDVRDAASAIQRARTLQARARTALITATAPVAAGVLLMFAGLPAWALPALGFFGTLLAARRVNDAPGAETARTRPSA